MAKRNNRTARVLKQLKSKPQRKVPITGNFFLPNHSGDHSAGIVRQTPAENTDIVNKEYVDGQNLWQVDGNYVETKSSRGIEFISGTEGDPGLWNEEFNVGFYAKFESGQNRITMVGDDTDIVDYSSTGAVHRVDCFYGRNTLAIGGSTNDGGFTQQQDPVLTQENINIQWPDKDRNIWIYCEFSERNRDWTQIWADDGEPAFMFYGSLNPEGVGNEEKYFVVQTNHSLGYTRLITGDGWDVHCEVDHWKFDGRLIRSKSVYTGTDTTDAVSLHICDSASAFTLTVSDGTKDGEEIKLTNRGTGVVTLSGKISTVTATSTLNSGETIVVNWDVTDDEWQ